MSNNAHAHRFHDQVAVSIGTGETVYMSVKESRKFTKALNRINRSIENESFQDSKNLTFSLELKS